MDYIRGLAKNISTPILTGAPTVAVISGKDAGDYNSALLFLKDGKLSAQYNKMHLVAFGEFIPFEKYLSWLRRVFPITGNFISGDEYTIFNLPPNFGVLICFEDIFPYISRRFVKDGADFMINITNDAWFGKTCAAYQHAANSVFRAIENRRPFVRSANTGLSCFIDRTGRIYDKINSQGRDLFVQGYKTAAIVNMPSEPFTFYTRFGDIFILFCLLITGFFIIDYLRRGRYNK
jgi:apolipoprotein N-acyltransferase